MDGPQRHLIGRVMRAAIVTSVMTLGLTLAAPVSAYAEELPAVSMQRQLPAVVRMPIPGTNGLFEYLELIQDGEAVGRAIARTGAAVDFLVGESDGESMAVEDMVLAPVEPSSYEEALTWAYQMSQVHDTVEAFAKAHGLDGWGISSDDSEEAALMSPLTAERLGLGTHAGNEADSTVDNAGSVAGDPTVVHIGGQRHQREQEPGYLYESGCAEITKNSDKSRWGGCYRRYTVDDRDVYAYYSGDESTASGKGTYWYDMTYGDTQHRYGNNGGSGEVIKWAPTSTMDSGRCKTVTTKLTYGMTELSETYNHCPDKIVPEHRTNSFKASWHGVSNGGVVAVAAECFVRIPNRYKSGFEYWIRRKYRFG